MEYDLGEEFHWNMKLLFLYVVAEYETPKNEMNTVTIWDTAVKRGRKQAFSYKKAMNELPLRDQHRLLRDRNVTLFLKYRTVPITGWLHTKELGRETFRAPDAYFRDPDSKSKR